MRVFLYYIGGEGDGLAERCCEGTSRLSRTANGKGSLGFYVCRLCPGSLERVGREFPRYA